MRFIRRCSACQAVLVSGAAFCSQCGAVVETKPDDPEKLVGQLKLIHLALCIGLLVMLGVMTYFRGATPGTPQRTPPPEILPIFGVAFALFVLPVRLLFRGHFRKGPKRNVVVYHQSKMIDWTLLEGPAILLAIIYFLTVGPWAWIALVVFAGLFFLLAFSWPSLEEFEAFAS